MKPTLYLLSVICILVAFDAHVEAQVPASRFRPIYAGQPTAIGPPVAIAAPTIFAQSQPTIVWQSGNVYRSMRPVATTYWPSATPWVNTVPSSTWQAGFTPTYSGQVVLQRPVLQSPTSSIQPQAYQTIPNFQAPRYNSNDQNNQVQSRIDAMDKKVDYLIQEVKRLQKP